MGSTVTGYEERHSAGATSIMSHRFRLSPIREGERETKQTGYRQEDIRAALEEIVGESPALKAALHLV